MGGTQVVLCGLYEFTCTRSPEISRLKTPHVRATIGGCAISPGWCDLVAMHPVETRKALRFRRSRSASWDVPFY